MGLDVGLPLGANTASYLGPTPWPSALPQLRNATEKYLKAASGVGLELLSVVALSVGLPENGFADIFDEPLVIERIMRYPTTDNLNGMDNAEIGCGAHYDFGGLTLLRQTDAPGLQVQRPTWPGSDGTHVKVERAAYSTARGTFFSDLYNNHSIDWTPVD